MGYIYPCVIDGNEKNGEGFAVTFPDVYGANTGGDTFREAIIMAEDCLVVALGAYIDCHEELPAPSPWQKGRELISVQPLIAAQLDLYTAMREKGIVVEDLAQVLKIAASDARKLLTLDYETSIGQVYIALEKVGSGAPVEETVA